MNNSIDVYIISDSRSDCLVKAFEGLEQVAGLVLVPAVFLSSEHLRDPNIVDPKAFRILNGRPPTRGEVGCAIAHRNVFEAFLASAGKWALVAEGDAVVGDGRKLLTRAFSILGELDAGSPIVIQFFTIGASPGRWANKGPVPLTYWSRMAPNAAVCYLINSQAANLLASKQFPVSDRADWPASASEIRFLVDKSNLVGHDNGAHSLVGGERMVIVRSRWLWRLSVWSSVHYVLNIRHFGSYSNYFRRMLQPRLVRIWYQMC